MEALALLLAGVALFLSYGKQKQLDQLRTRLRTVEDAMLAAAPAMTAKAVTEAGDVVVTVKPEPVAAPAEPAVPKAAMPKAQAGWTTSGRVQPNPPPSETASRQPKAPRAKIDMEKLVGVHLPVWGGAVMLLIAGFFLTRMAAENGFLTPTLGVIACAIGALAALAGAFVVKAMRIANHAQIAAALAAAAIGTLYATAFMASAAFGLTSLFVGFLLSAGTAVLALSIAFAFGRPVLAVGLLGGYLAPFFLLSDAPGDGVFQLYLAALLIAGAVTCFRQGWQALLTPMLLLHFAWLTALVTLRMPSDDPSIATVLLLVATPLTVFVLAERFGDLGRGAVTPTDLSASLAVLLLLIGCESTDFSIAFLVGFGALALGISAMSIMFRSRSLNAVYAVIVGWVLLLAIWRQPEYLTRLLMVIAMLPTLALPLIAALRKGLQAPRAASVLCMVSAASFVTTMVDLDGWGGVRDLPYLWAGLALAFSAAAAFGGRLFGRTAPDDKANTVRGIFGASASAFVSIAVVAVVDADYFALAAALQVAGLALVYRRYPIGPLLSVMGAYVAIFFGLLALSIMWPSGYGGFDPLAGYVPTTPPWHAPVVALLLPALAFVAAATILRGVKSALVTVLDVIAVLVAALAITYLVLPEPGEIRAIDTLIWSSLWGNGLLLLGLVALLAGARLARPGLQGAGLGVLFATLAGVGVLAGGPAYAFWPAWNVPGLPLLNVAVTGLMVPGVVALVLARLFAKADKSMQPLRWALAVVGGWLALTGVLVDIRHLFHPDMLQGTSGAIERYCYSGGMLLMAFAALVVGTRLDSQPLRYGSLVIMLATVAKVFLFDTSGLDGLWRVASFVAMGLALLATSWFYGRYVFGRRSNPGDATAGVTP